MGLAGAARRVAQERGAGFQRAGRGSGRIILFHRVANEEVVEALDPRTGATQWRYTTSYRDDFGFDEGPRAVPVIANGISTRSVRKGSCMPSTWPRARACGASIRCSDTVSRKDSSVRLDHHSSKTAGFSPTSGARMQGSSPSMQRQDRRSGPRRMTRRATHLQPERPSRGGESRFSSRVPD